MPFLNYRSGRQVDPESTTFKAPEMAELKDVEILDEGLWSGNKKQLVTSDDILQMITNFKAGIVEPFLTIDHNDDYTEKVKDFLKVASLGWVSDLRRKGTKLVADFKQVPAKVAELIKAGTLKKRSVEFYPKGAPYRTNGKSFENVLTAVTFFGADKPAVTSLRDDFEVLMLVHDRVNSEREGAVVLQEKLNSEENLKTKFSKEHLDALKSHLEAASKCMQEHMEGEGEGEGEGEPGNDEGQEGQEVDIAQQIEELAKKLEDMHAEMKKMAFGKKVAPASAPAPAAAEGEGEGKSAKFKDMESELSALRKFKAEAEKANVEAVKAEAEKFANDNIATGRVLPKAKDMIVKQYLQFKAEGDEALSLFREDIANRPEAEVLQEIKTQFTAPDGSKPTGKKVTEFKSTDELQAEIERIMKADKCSWEEADKKIAARKEMY